MKREIITNALIISFSLLIGLILAELCLRLFVPETKQEYLELPVVGHRPIGSDRDERGFRNQNVLDSAEIVAIGDSQTEGLNAKADEAWPQVLGNLSSTTIYQMAYGGSGVAHYFYLFDEALSKNPKIIIIGLYLGNDMYDTFEMVYTNDYFIDKRDPAVEKIASDYMLNSLSAELYQSLKTGDSSNSNQTIIKRTREWLRENIKLYKLLGNVTRSVREKIGVAKNESQKQADIKLLATENPDQAFYFDTNPNIKTVLSPSYRLPAVDIADVPAQEGIRLTNTFLKEAQKKADEKGIELLVAIIPTKESVYKRYFDKVGINYTDELEKIVNLEQVTNDSVLQICENSAIKCHTVVEKMSNALMDGVKIYPESINGHPTNLGYAVIARSLLDFLEINTETKQIK